MTTAIHMREGLPRSPMAASATEPALRFVPAHAVHCLWRLTTLLWLWRNGGPEQHSWSIRAECGSGVLFCSEDASGRPLVAVAGHHIGGDPETESHLS